MPAILGISHTESTAVWYFKLEPSGSPLVQGKYQEESLWQETTIIIIIIIIIKYDYIYIWISQNITSIQWNMYSVWYKYMFILLLFYYWLKVSALRGQHLQRN
jgi:hypothetical protein